MSTPNVPRKNSRRKSDNEHDAQHAEFVMWTLQHWARKFRDDSLWKRMSPEQCEQLERWMFEENLTYEVIVERVKSEFGMETSMMSLSRLYRELALIRQQYDLFNADLAANKVNDLFGTTEGMRQATIKILAKSAVSLAVDKPGAVGQLLPLARVLLESEENEIRLRRVKLEEQQFEYEAAMANHKPMEKVRAFVASIVDNQYITQEEKNERVAELKKDLFGKADKWKPAMVKDAEQKLKWLVDWGKAQSESVPEEPAAKAGSEGVTTDGGPEEKTLKEESFNG